MDKGYIKLNRKFFNHPFWTKQRVYSEAEAWLDLIQSARFDGTNEYVNNKLIELGRGEIPVSIRFNAKRWSWGDMRVRGFFETLEKLSMITQRQHNGQRIIRLVKYGLYNDSQHSKQDENNTVATQQQHSSNTAATQNIRTKELKKDNELNKAKALVIANDDEKQKQKELKEEYKKLLEDLTYKPVQEVWLGLKNFVADKKPNWGEPYHQTWNLFASNYKLPELEALTPGRRKKLKMRMAEEGFDFIKILEKIKISPHLKGDNANNWRCSFDWIIDKHENFLKIIEGNYG